jgi:hypothetical protein
VNGDPAFAEAVAQRVVELLREQCLIVATGRRELLTAAEVADRFGLSASYVRRHADDLGAIRLGAGPKARLRFDPERVIAGLTGRDTCERSGTPQTQAETYPKPRRNRR